MRAEPWTQFVKIDPAYPQHFVREDGQHLFLFNKTAWHYFTADKPQITLDRARALGASVIRVGLDQQYYFSELHRDGWPWGGTRSDPDFTTFNEPYWDEVDERIRLAAANGIGINLTLFTALQLPDVPESIEKMKPYLERVMARLAHHPNIFCWEVHNEYARNPNFQRWVGEFLKQHDPHRRPVTSSDGTTDYPLWVNEPWMDLAVVHTCTSSEPRYDLRDWYLAVARNLRATGKPAFNSETGREKRHHNDDPVHRRKQMWIAAAAGTYTTWHSWDGCEGIDDAAYVAPGQSFVHPFAQWWSQQEFWRVNPDLTCLQLEPDDASRGELVPVVLASPARDLVLAYLFARKGGASFPQTQLRLRLPDGEYRIEHFRPADGTSVGKARSFTSTGLRDQGAVSIPAFTDDLALRIRLVSARAATAIPGTK